MIQKSFEMDIVNRLLIEYRNHDHIYFLLVISIVGTIIEIAIGLKTQCHLNQMHFSSITEYS